MSNDIGNGNAMTAIAKRTSVEEREVVYTPFQSHEKLTLTASMVTKFLCKPTKRGFTCTTEHAVRFMMLCKARALNPWEGDAYLVGFDGQDGPEFNLITAHQAFLKRAEVHPAFDGMESGVVVDAGDGAKDIEGDFIEDGMKLIGGWARVHRNDRKIPVYRRLNLSAFNKGFSVWRTNPQGMISKCFDEETEVLTDEGFQKFSEATGRVLQVTDAGLSAVDAVPFVQQYSGDMITFDSDDLNFSVTPNHDMITVAGKIEAGEMFETARSRAIHWIPRCVRSNKPSLDVTDDAIRLAAIYLADGYDKPHGTFWVGVSRDKKVKFLESLGGFTSRHVAACEGSSVISGGRTITSKKDKQMFGYSYDAISPIAVRGKKISIPVLLAMSSSQARVFVDTLIQMDGHTRKNTGVRIFYSSRPNLVAAFEVACVIAGYSVSDRKTRTSDISSKENTVLSISERSEIGVRRWGRPYRGDKGSRRNHTGLEKTDNKSGRVWCVTVPSGVIVVRRHGFSMLCGNCAEADALRSAFPNSLAGMYGEGEIVGEPTNGTDTPKLSGVDRLQQIVDAAPAPKVIDVVEREKPMTPDPVATVTATPAETPAPTPKRSPGRPRKETTTPAPAAVTPPVDPVVESAKPSMSMMDESAPVAEPPLTQLTIEEQKQVDAWLDKASNATAEVLTAEIESRKNGTTRKERLFVKTLRDELSRREPVKVNQVEEALNMPVDTSTAQLPPVDPPTDVDGTLTWEQFLAQAREFATAQWENSEKDTAKLTKLVDECERATKSKFPLRNRWVGDVGKKAATPEGQTAMFAALELMASGKWNWADAKPI